MIWEHPGTCQALPLDCHNKWIWPEVDIFTRKLTNSPVLVHFLYSSSQHFHMKHHNKWIWQEVDIFIRKGTSYNWPIVQSGSIFYAHHHSIFIWNILNLNILDNYAQNILFLQHRIKCFAADKISVQVLFFLKDKKDTFSCSMSTHQIFTSRSIFLVACIINTIQS